MKNMDSILTLLTTFVFGFILFKLQGFLYWCKWIISYKYIENSRKNTKKRLDLYDYSTVNNPLKVNFIDPEEEYDLEYPKPESHLKIKNDEIFFYGANSKCELLAVKINRRLGNRAESLIYLRLASGKSYQLEKNCGFQQSGTDESTFTCGGLRLQCLRPMRRWRIFYAGYLREIEQNTSIETKNVERNMVYVKITFLWGAASDVFDFEDNISSKVLADGLAKASWKNCQPPIQNLDKILNFYGQAGTIHGNVTIGDSSEEIEIYLFGQRIRNICDTLNETELCHVLGYTKKRGTYIHVGKITSERILKDLLTGFVIQPDTDLREIKKVSAPLSDLNQKRIKIKFKTDAFAYKLEGTMLDIIAFSRNDGSKDVFKRIEFKLNEEVGSGILYRRVNSKIETIDQSHLMSVENPSVIPAVVSFKDNICQLPEITGGKGFSLGKLTKISSNNKMFSVPDGVVVTTTAYSDFLSDKIRKKIKLLEEKSYKVNADSEEISEACERVSDEIVKSDFSKGLRDVILEKLTEQFDKKILTHKFAVRSSATGEDTEQMSAAGQMETFLGVSGIERILSSVKKCWASQFNFIAVQYKRNYGQKINSPMAVVIQEMISCDVAGVLFTCDPLSGNPTVISITSNYGLGESVVSASEEPDTIQLVRDDKDNLDIKSIHIGEKQHKIVIEDGKGINTTENSENERNKCSLSDEMIFQLGQTGIEIENNYRSHRDVEWGFYNNTLFIFQSRPVTNSCKETLFEIDHEFDAPMRVENDFYSVANVGEVMPKALSPLGIDVGQKLFRIWMNCMEKKSTFQLSGRSQYFSKGYIFMHNHYVFNVADVIQMNEKKQMSLMNKATLIALFGRLPNNDEMFEVSKARYATAQDQNPFVAFYSLIKTTLATKKILEDGIKTFTGYKISIEEYDTTEDLLKALLCACTDLNGVAMILPICSQTSSLWNLIIFYILGHAQGSFDENVYRDFARLVKSDADIESADVPSATQKIAWHVAQEMTPEEFKKKSTEEALNWFQTTESIAGQKFRSFIERHGHRCLQEFDLYSHPWRETPEMFVQLLQNLVGNITREVNEKKLDDLNELFSELTVPLGFVSKFLLKFIIPIARRSVGYRETAKSMCIKGLDEWRKGWRKLAQLMVQEGRLPEEDLLFFMTIDDVHNLLKTNSPRIISRANQRKRRYPVVVDYRFPEIMKGFPRPINDAQSEILPSELNFSMKGLPMSQGVAKGFVRKALTLNEAAQLKPGEILITYSTDIGWSPYFPHLAGVVTELGGLISHGAVVSREYGIPCIAGLHGVTKYFQTGDYVVLDGNKGILQKLEHPETTK